MSNRRPSRPKQSSFKRSTGSNYDSDRSMGSSPYLVAVRSGGKNKVFAFHNEKERSAFIKGGESISKQEGVKFIYATSFDSSRINRVDKKESLYSRVKRNSDIV